MRLAGETDTSALGKEHGVMKQIGELKENTEAVESIDEAGVELGDEQLDGVAGGMRSGIDDPYCKVECPRCGKLVAVMDLPRHNAVFHKK